MNISVKKLLAAVSMSWCLAAQADATLEPAWTKAPMYLPGNSFATTAAANEQPARGTPLVIYLHGCAGIDSGNDRGWARFLADNGYAVIMPDSFARPARISACDPSTQTWDGRRFPGIWSYRQQEITLALERSRSLPWVDPNRIYLMGHSEGAWAASNWMGGGFRAVVISAYPCTPSVATSISLSTPILNLLFTHDPWFMDDRRCSRYRSNVEEVVISARAHSTYPYREMRQKVLEFLGGHR